MAGIGVLADVAKGAPERDVDRIERAVKAGDYCVGELVEAALAACADGDAAEALALGHDLHWLSDGDAQREAWAGELLAAAYARLGRGALAGIAAAHSAGRGPAAADLYP